MMAGQQQPPRRNEAILVFWTKRPSRCAECKDELGSGSFIHLRDREAFCMDCADLGHLVFLARGDQTLTRRAGKHSRLRAVVVRWSDARKRYERQGILVEQPALRRAEEECRQDSGRRAAERAGATIQRERQDQRYVEEFARAVRERYPGCPEGAEVEVAVHACEKYSGRVGRTAAAKALDADAIDLAVRAHVRHRRTPYDGYLMEGRDRDDARTAVGDEVEQVLERWRVALDVTSGPRRGAS